MLNSNSMCVEQQAKGKNKSELKYWQYMAISSPKHWIPLPISNQYTFTLLDVFKWIRNIGSNREEKRRKEWQQPKEQGFFQSLKKEGKIVEKESNWIKLHCHLLDESYANGKCMSHKLVSSEYHLSIDSFYILSIHPFSNIYIFVFILFYFTSLQFFPFNIRIRWLFKNP